MQNADVVDMVVAGRRVAGSAGRHLPRHGAVTGVPVQPHPL